MKSASSAQTGQRVLLADIGDTNARFALPAGGTVGMVADLAVVGLRALAEVEGIG